MQYTHRVRGQLARAVNEKYFDAVRAQLAPIVKDVTDKNAAEKSAGVQDAFKISQSVGPAADAAGAPQVGAHAAEVDAGLKALAAKYPDLSVKPPALSDLAADCDKLYWDMNAGNVDGAYKRPLPPELVGERVNEILHKHEGEVHLTPSIPFGNLWASCYFAMTGFHALHVFGGLVDLRDHPGCRRPQRRPRSSGTPTCWSWSAFTGTLSILCGSSCSRCCTWYNASDQPVATRGIRRTP